MQILNNKKIYIPVVVVLMAVMVVTLSPTVPAVAQSSGDVDSSDPSYGEKSHEGKDKKSCSEKKNRSSTETSGSKA